MVRRIAGVMAILWFALACLLGAVAGCSLETALFRALVAMVAFFLVGLAVGHGTDLLMREHFRLLAASNDEEETDRTQDPSPRQPNGTQSEEY